ncbi:MAG: AAA-like domain-containing protein [Coleofasciculus sp. A1-SPW-01]|uniref:AAA-like domain-containing protein n=1 Tax=Coleofasciculus sp. A1-SPW-01 TaxID=3070819 RepID=UPI0032FBF345
MPRSLQVHSHSVSRVKSSLLRNGFPSQKLLAEALSISQSTVSNFLNGKPVDYINFVELCAALGQEWRDIADLETPSPASEVREIRAKVLMSGYAPHFNLTQTIQQAICQAGHDVFLAQQNTALDNYLKLSDYLLLLLSQTTAVSEMVLEQVRLAKTLHHITPQKPAILPILVDVCQNGNGISTPLPFDLLGYLQGTQPWHWRCHDDPTILASEVLQVLSQGRTALPTDHQLAISWSKLTPQTQKNTSLHAPLPVAAPELPEGQVDLDSTFYINRPPIESVCYETITRPGALIRIKAPRQMGKTSLMARILRHAEQQGSQTVALSLQLANQRILANSNTFLEWFCASVSLALGRLDPEQLAKYAQLADMIGSNQSCKAYFEQYLLPHISTSLTLGLDEVDRLFASPEIADDFFGLLRALHEEAKRREIWQKFRLVVVHSTEVYVPLDMNKSPFNVGLPIELPEFNQQQVMELARRHGLEWSIETVDSLVTLVGGHPYLVRLALYHIARQDMTLEDIQQTAPTEAGIYSDHLRRHLWNLQTYPELLDAMKAIVMASTPVRLPSQQAFKLNSMGLVKLFGNDCTPRCQLYQKYFRDRLA